MKPFRRIAGGNFYVVYRLNDHQKLKCLGTSDPKKAQRLANDLTARLSGSRGLLTSFQALLDEFRNADAETLGSCHELVNCRLRLLEKVERLKLVDVGTGLAKSYQRPWQTFIGGLKKEFVDELTADDFQKHLDFLVRGGWSRDWAMVVQACFKSACRQMVRAKQLFANIADDLKVGKGNSYSRQAFTAEQIGLLLKAAEPRDLADLILTAANTGLRLGDLRDLRWADLVTDQGRVTIRRLQNKTRGPVTIPLRPEFAEWLLSRTKSSAFVLPWANQTATSTLTARMGRLVEKIGLAPSKSIAGRRRKIFQYGFHSCRHFYASTLADAGVAGMALSRAMGHSSLSMVQRYVHDTTDSRERIRNGAPTLTIEASK